MGYLNGLYAPFLDFTPFFRVDFTPFDFTPLLASKQGEKKIGIDGFVPPGGQLLTPMSDRHPIGFL